jgi:hypothetical protein
MTAVQWWCSGVVLNRILRPSAAPPPRQNADVAAGDVASEQAGPSQNSQQPSSQQVGGSYDGVG